MENIGQMAEHGIDVDPVPQAGGQGTAGGAGADHHGVEQGVRGAADVLLIC